MSQQSTKERDIEKPLHEGKLVNVNYEGTTYYMWSMHSWLLN